MENIKVDIYSETQMMRTETISDQSAVLRNLQERVNFMNVKNDPDLIVVYMSSKIFFHFSVISVFFFRTVH